MGAYLKVAIFLIIKNSFIENIENIGFFTGF